MGGIMKFWIATGGTGGHIFPAVAVADELARRGHCVVVSTDARGLRHIRGGRRRVRVWASGVGARSMARRAASLIKMSVSTVALTVRFLFSRPDKIVAFGGYSCVPVLIAGRIWRIPAFLHEQNAVMGRANKFAMPFVKTLMTSFPIGAGILVGLPVRRDFYSAVARPESGRLLITGGSLGAAVLDDVVPKAVRVLPANMRRDLFVIHQTRPENVEKLRREYADLGVKNNILSFIKDMAGELSAASLVISRSGAGTVAEMQAVGVPAILVPLGINPDQMANARAFAQNGGGIVITQADFTPELVARHLGALIGNPERLARMAAKAHAVNNAVNNILDVIL
ncbi:MAG: UDP-N-acetylglucosamine--N-acetylmuramyl-(pentapeptide) pyrophosphoryl-undecaprenol N-acetylglucosamine transferase [Rickettsiales bacterium]|jgi:UDP-N-acetylglucosamine--N-acetylmuramyl-(pentapeptide) pyrophosphoryl-undecaprenol N-acetylglucosamine transferase|nr:UDP-N-acetylglucosamine--N-acetylmuramyl-(pentapeptide) pyrophosphoryl-undecaprenol N-acetylglucosamine transferase [Rickettsiales bacterium]